MKKISPKEVKNSINKNVRDCWTVKYIGRPVAAYMTPYFYRNQWKADGITCLRSGLAVLGMLALLAPTWGLLLSFLMFYLCFFLDCVDGNIARLTDTATYYGKFIDGLSDLLYVVGYPLFVGCTLLLSNAELIYPMLGISSSIMVLICQLVRTRLSFFRDWMAHDSTSVQVVVDGSQFQKRIQTICAGAFVNGRFFATFLILVPDNGFKLYVVAIFITQFIPQAVYTGISLCEASRTLRAYRKSVHSV